MKKTLVINIFVVVVSMTIALVIGEYAFRSMVFSENKAFESLKNPADFALYFNDPNEDLYNEDYWKLLHLFGKMGNITEPHPLLGWTGFFDPLTYDHWHADKTKTKRPVLLFGDSFAMCVDSVECYEDFLNNDTSFAKGHHFLNYGVGGYGIDQIYLLLRETIDKYENPFVVLSMLTTDMDRSMLKVRDGQKPYFTLGDNGLQLKGTPITLPTKEYLAENPPEVKSYLANKLINLTFHDLVKTESQRKKYIERIKALNGQILNSCIQLLEANNIEFVVLLFQPAWNSPFDWRIKYLKETCLKNEAAFIDDAEIRNEKMEELGLYKDAFVIPNDGHPTSLANFFVANEIKSIILDTAYFFKIKERSLSYDVNEKEDLRKHYRASILNSKEWLEAVKIKAKENGISLDSMISIDVDYLIERHQP